MQVKSFRRGSQSLLHLRYSWLVLLAVTLSIAISGRVLAQQPGSEVMHAANQPVVDTTTPSSYIFGGIGAFIPLSQSFRLNYSTKTLGVPIEVSGGFLFPITPTIQAPLTIRYMRREANFLNSTSISILSIEPGVRAFLEKARPNDLRIFLGAEVIVGRAHVVGEISSTESGSDALPQPAYKDYLNLGLGLDLGFTVAFTNASAVDAVVHAGQFLGSPVAQGGIGNIGGISLSAYYRYGF